MADKIKAAVLGATGMVGQRFLKLLENHPQIQVQALCASSNSAGKKYCNAAKWLVEGEMPEKFADMTVLECTPQAVKKASSQVDLVFSSLPGDAAQIAEPLFAKEGFAVISKASAYRMQPDVPLIIPEVNPQHLDLIKVQQKNRGFAQGFISTDPNCSTAQLAIALKPLHDEFKIKRVYVSTMQALSGAGYPGVPSLDISDNAIPYIAGEEEKIETETLKLLGTYSPQKQCVQNAQFEVSANCCRINVSEGHLESAFIEFETTPNQSQLEKALENFSGLPQKLKLHSAPANPIIVRNEPDRPQPRRDRNAQNAMAISVGRIRCEGNKARMFILGHNTVRGAAGNGVLHAELLIAQKII